MRRLGPFGLLAIAIWLYLIWLPISDNVVLYSLFAVLGVVALIASLRAPRLYPLLIPIIFIQLAFGIFGVAIGATNRDPGIKTQAILYLVVPVLFWLCVKATDRALLVSLVKAGAWATIGLCLTIVLYDLQTKGHIAVLPTSFLNLEQTYAAGQRLTFIGIESLLILGPLYSASVVLPRHPSLPSRRLRIAAALAALVALVLSGRQALIVVDVLSPLIAAVVGRRFLGISKQKSDA